MVVPSYRRPEGLARCLEGLDRQLERPTEVVVVRRNDDETSAVVLARHPRVRVVAVERPGVVAAMVAGASAAVGEVIAFCDDDAVPRPDWAARLVEAFTDPHLGGLGGRDFLVPPHPAYPPTELVGLVSGWGRVTGEHHRGAGAARPVHVLKAVNMAFRRPALAFPEGLRGAGAQVHFEVPICLWALGRGWELRYDPELVVDHDPEQRFDADRRDRPAASAIRDAAFNLTLGLLACRPGLARRRVAFGLGIGDRGTPGLLRAAVALMRGDRETVRRLWPSLRGQLEGFRAARQPGALVARALPET